MTCPISVNEGSHISVMTTVGARVNVCVHVHVCRRQELLLLRKHSKHPNGAVKAILDVIQCCLMLKSNASNIAFSSPITPLVLSLFLLP